MLSCFLRRQSLQCCSDRKHKLPSHHEVVSAVGSPARVATCRKADKTKQIQNVQVRFTSQGYCTFRHSLLQCLWFQNPHLAHSFVVFVDCPKKVYIDDCFSILTKKCYCHAEPCCKLTVIWGIVCQDGHVFRVQSITNLQTVRCPKFPKSVWFYVIYKRVKQETQVSTIISVQ